MKTATKVSHTPGPWTLIELGSHNFQVTAKGQTAGYEEYDVALCIVSQWDGEPPAEQIQANARLISAAPDLLEACEAAKLAFRAVPKRTKDYSYQLDLLNAAIAKARGT